MKNLLLTAAAFAALASPASAQMFCGPVYANVDPPLPLDTCLSVQGPMVPILEGNGVTFSDSVITIRLPNPHLGFRSLSFVLNFEAAGYAPPPAAFDFELLPTGRTQSFEPNIHGPSYRFFAYGMVSRDPVREVRLSVEEPPDFRGGIFLSIRDVYASGVTRIGRGHEPSTWAMSTPEPSTWAMSLIGFGILGALGWRRALKVKPQ